jgi:hypothetical protein
MSGIFTGTIGGVRRQEISSLEDQHLTLLNPSSRTLTLALKNVLPIIFDKAQTSVFLSQSGMQQPNGA